eukprot:9823058-Karenia_brevis.AAC.1
MSPEAAVKLMASPWHRDAPPCTALARSNESAINPPDDTASGALAQQICISGWRGYEGLTGRLTRAASLLEAAEAAQEHDEDARANALQHGGRGCGT